MKRKWGGGETERQRRENIKVEKGKRKWEWWESERGRRQLLKEWKLKEVVLQEIILFLWGNLLIIL
jgi:hypothetical protein